MRLYAIKNKEDKYYRSKGYGGYGKSWVDTLEEAKIYTKPGPAKAQITYWGKNFPDYGIPDLVILEAAIMDIEPQQNRVEKTVKEIKQRESKRKMTILKQQKERLDKEFKQLKKDLTELDEKEVLERGYF